MVRITCIIKPHRLEQVKSAIASLGVSGMNVTDVRGCGNSPEKANWFGGEEVVVALPLRSKVEVIAPDDMKEAIIEAILEYARSGDSGDGKIFVEQVEDAIRIRTRETGDAAI